MSMIALIQAYKAGLFNIKHWYANIVAGLIVGVVALPLAMAFAIASGVKPEQGLYTAIIAGLCVGIFGGSPVQIAGPTGAFVVILASITAEHGVVGLQIASFLAGMMLLLMGLMKLGDIIKFIPEPVIAGFTAGIGFIIFMSEWKEFLGLDVSIPIDASFYQKFLALTKALPTFHLTTTLVASLSLVLILITPKLLKRIPGPLVAILIPTALQGIFQFQGVATLGSVFGGIPQQLPQFHFPLSSFQQIFSLIGPAFTIALLGAIESLLSATAADGMAGTKHHSNQELIGQGVANIIAPLFGGFAATGAIARTATNIRNGGNSPLSSIIHSLFLLLTILLLAPLAVHIPLCSLAAILFVVAYNMSNIPHFKHMVKDAPYYDVIVLLTTFLLTIFTNLIIAVNAGVILAMLFFIRRMNQFFSIREQSLELLQQEIPLKVLQPSVHNTLIYAIQGPLFFGATEKLEGIFSKVHTRPQNIILRLKEVPFMDMSGLETFQKMIKRFHSLGIQVALCEANTLVSRKLLRAGIATLIKEQKIFPSFLETLQTFNKPVAYQYPFYPETKRE